MTFKKIAATMLSILTIATVCVSCAPGEQKPTETTKLDATGEQKPTETTQQASQTDDSLEKIKEKGFFIVGLDDTFTPMGFRNEKDEIVGFDIDLARAVAAKMNLEVKFQPVVWAAIAQEINSGNVDVIWNGCTITKEREEIFNFSKPYMDNQQVVVVLKQSPYKQLSDLSGKIGGIQEGSSSQIAFENNAQFKGSIKEMVSYPTNDKALLDLSAKRTDFVVVDICVFVQYDKVKPNTFVALEQDLGSEKFGVAFKKESNAFREAFAIALDECVADGSAQKISETWFGKDLISK